MKISFGPLFIGLFIFFGCQKSKNQDEEMTIDTNIVKAEGNRVTENTDLDTVTILLKRGFAHEFSNTVEKDSFNIWIKGKTIHTGRIKFEIKNNKGEVIYSDWFPTSNIWGITMADSTTKSKENHVLDFVSRTFSDIHFSSPAVKSDEVFEADFSEKEIWEELKRDSLAIGFYYSGGFENGKSIAYIKRLKRAVVYFECC